jgi:uncharacterized membrane protein YhaH (DUF805 family)
VDGSGKRAPGFLLALLVGNERVNRRRFVLCGLVLAVLKFTIDSFAYRATTGQIWSPLFYLDPHLASWFWFLPGGGKLALVLWTLPFTWIGVSMNARRAADAGLSPWWAVCFLIPFANYLLIVVLCLVPTAARPAVARPPPAIGPPRPGPVIVSAALAIFVSTALVAFIVYVTKGYGFVLFVAVPFLFGAVLAYVLNRLSPVSGGATVWTVLLSLVAMGTTFVLTALEGAGCVVMMLPIAIPLALLGAGLGRSCALVGRTPARHACIVVLAAPVLAFVEPLARGEDFPLHEVRSSIEIAAPPEVVWSRLIAFGAIPDPPEWMFRLGVACPQGARIEGHGVRATRYCEFTTGPFVEPITTWDAPRRLAFDVAAQPPPMVEWSPYEIHPPHLDGFLRSRRGEFRLIALPNGGTRLEGSTWYTLDIHPDPYWRLWADFLVRAIHERVLRHVRRLAEGR